MFRRLKPTLAAVAVFLGLTAWAQNNPAAWSTGVEKISEDTYRITLAAEIEEGWHIYDSGPYDDSGPNATVVTFEPSEGIEPAGETVCDKISVRYFDEMFGMEIGYYEGTVKFSKDFRLAADAGSVKVYVEWMACNEGSCIPPEEAEFNVALPSGQEEAAATITVGPETTTDSGKSSIWSVIIEAILWGFAALLTPCVFPMVPMTVSFFIKGQGSPARGRFNALLYGLFIVALYTLPIAAIIMITKIVGGDTVTADIFNWLATHWLPNIIFFIVFMVFAASFFGAFEITMPSSLVNRSDAKADKGGLGGIFFMAMTLVLVSFSCTGPIVGSVLIKSTAGEFWEPILTMLAFSIAFALPFTLFAFFPSLLRNLPKSGGWLNSVKVVLGFIEVALGLKFLSVADQTYHWGLLDREIYLAIWIAVFSLLGLYLIGKIRFAHDSELKHVGVGRLFLAIATFSFVVYLIPGMFGAPLKGLSGYLPPLHTQDFKVGADVSSVETIAAKDAAGSGGDYFTPGGRTPRFGDMLHLPHGLNGFFDIEEAEEYAARVGKPLFIDFTGHGCVNCREMEQRVWSDEHVLDMLRNDYVVVALYSDDKMKLPESDWITTDNGKELKQLGKKNSYLALKNYGVNAQPYYILQGRNGRILAEPRGYDLDVDGFVEFLQKGLDAYEVERQRQ